MIVQARASDLFLTVHKLSTHIYDVTGIVYGVAKGTKPHNYGYP